MQYTKIYIKWFFASARGVSRAPAHPAGRWSLIGMFIGTAVPDMFIYGRTCLSTAVPDMFIGTAVPVTAVFFGRSCRRVRPCMQPCMEPCKACMQPRARRACMQPRVHESQYGVQPAGGATALADSHGVVRSALCSANWAPGQGGGSQGSMMHLPPRVPAAVVTKLPRHASSAIPIFDQPAAADRSGRSAMLGLPSI